MSSLISRNRKDGTRLSRREEVQIQSEGILAQRRNAMAELNAQIEEAERELHSTNAEISYRLKQISNDAEKMIGSSEEEEEENTDILDLLEANKKEMERSKEDFSQKLETLKEEYKKKVVEAEKWSEEHIASIVQEKKLELNSVEEELENLKRSNKLTMHETNVSVEKVIDSISKAGSQNDNRVKYLQDQIYSIVVSTKEEVRDAKMKIQGTISTIELREIEHRNTLKQYEMEIASREKLYSDLYNSLISQQNAEKESIEKAMRIAVAKAQNALSVQKKIEKFHEKQIQTSRQDSERLKYVLSATKSKDDVTLRERSGTESQIHDIKKQIDEVEADGKVISEMVAELKNENQELQQELSRITKNLYPISQ